MQAFGTSTRSDIHLKKPVTVENTVNKPNLTPSHFQSEWTSQGFEEMKSPEIAGPKIQVLGTAWWKGLLSLVFALAEDGGFGT